MGNQGCQNAGIGCLECKKPVIDAITAELEPIQKEAEQFENDLTWFAQFFWRAARRHENRPVKRLQKFAQQWASVPGSKLDGVGIASQVEYHGQT